MYRLWNLKTRVTCGNHIEEKRREGVKRERERRKGHKLLQEIPPSPRAEHPDL